jgi:hypothetical protein
MNNAIMIDITMKAIPAINAVFSFIIPEGIGLLGLFVLSDLRSVTSLWIIRPADRNAAARRVIKI